jgi:hypothetical protein
MVLADRRVFAVMAFINAAGYDEEMGGEQMVPTRVAVRAMVAANLANHRKALEQWRDYYAGNGIPSFAYLDYAMSLCADYPFRRIRPDSELMYLATATMLSGFPDTLNAFWAAASLADVWAKVKPDYIAELKKYNLEKMDSQMTALWSYLRMKRTDSYALVNVPNLLDSHYFASGARYENYFYSIESPGSHQYALNRHEYLHTVINHLVREAYPGAEGKLKKYYQAGKDLPYCRSYQDPTGFTSECLVRAIDRRLRLEDATEPDALAKTYETIAKETKGGLILVRPVFDLLPDYEKSGESFPTYLPKLFVALAEYEPPPAGAAGGDTPKK